MLEASVAEARRQREAAESRLASLREEFGPEIARVSAEFDRMRRRHEDERAARAASITEEAVKEMLPLMDSFFNAKVPSVSCLGMLQFRLNIFA
jgi:molecular chaperone GrpE (heat shock protein)